MNLLLAQFFFVFSSFNFPTVLFSCSCDYFSNLSFLLNLSHRDRERERARELWKNLCIFLEMISNASQGAK